VAFQTILKVCNPSPYQRSDYVEVDDLKALKVPSGLDDRHLRLLRLWHDGSREEIPFQVDYPFGKKVGYRSLTFFSRDTPPCDLDYRHHSAEFFLEEANPRDFGGTVDSEALKVEHCSVPGKFHRNWDPTAQISGVELSNGIAPTEAGFAGKSGLRVYFSLVPRPEPASPFNYAGAATSVLHYRSWQSGGADMLAPYDLIRPHSPRKCWGQVTTLDFYPLPWERRFYQSYSLLRPDSTEPRYSLAWSRSGPLRATVTLKSEPFHVQYGGGPFLKPEKAELPCYLYRILSLYMEKEFYTEQLIVRPELGLLDPGDRISLAFRAHYYSYLDYPDVLDTTVARSEKIPDYFAVWKQTGDAHRGYAFASDSHVRQLEVWPEWQNVLPTEIRWRLQLGHEHRCVHLFPFLGAYPHHNFEPYHEIGHTGWYERLLKPLQVLPLNRYVSP